MELQESKGQAQNPRNSSRPTIEGFATARSVHFSNERQLSAHRLVMRARPIQAPAAGTLRERRLGAVYVRRDTLLVIFFTNLYEHSVTFETPLERVCFYVQLEVPGYGDELLERVLGTNDKDFL